MKRFNNKILVVVLLVLAVAFVLTRVFRSPARESNLDADALKVDTSGIEKIQLYPAADERREVTLTKAGRQWKVSRGKINSHADGDRVETLLSRLATLQPERIATRKEEKWDDYQVGDSTGTEVVVFTGSDEQRLKVGKENMGVTFVRPGGEDEVYAVSGSIASALNLKLEDWRDPLLLQVMKDAVQKITFQYPADSGFVLAKNGKTWSIDNAPADSAKTESYLNKLRLKKLTTFTDDFSADSPPDATMTIEAPAPFIVKGWKLPSGEWVLTSDQQPGTYFLDKGNAVAREIFPGKKRLMK